MLFCLGELQFLQDLACQQHSSLVIQPHIFWWSEKWALAAKAPIEIDILGVELPFILIGILGGIETRANLLKHAIDLIETVLAHDRVELLARLLLVGAASDHILNQVAVQLVPACDDTYPLLGVRKLSFGH